MRKRTPSSDEPLTAVFPSSPTSSLPLPLAYNAQSPVWTAPASGASGAVGAAAVAQRPLLDIAQVGMSALHRRRSARIAQAQQHDTPDAKALIEKLQKFAQQNPDAECDCRGEVRSMHNRCPICFKRALGVIDEADPGAAIAILKETLTTLKAEDKQQPSQHRMWEGATVDDLLESLLSLSVGGRRTRGKKGKRSGYRKKRSTRGKKRSTRGKKRAGKKSRGSKRRGSKRTRRR